MGTLSIQHVPRTMSDKKVRIDEELLNKIKRFRGDKELSMIYPSDKYFVQIAILDLLKKIEEKKP